MTALGIVLAHLVGDYLIQSHWMATRKTEAWGPAIAHGVTYTIPYMLVTQSPAALAVIAVTHIVIDRYRLAKHLMWLKNQLDPTPSRPTWAEAKTNAGYSASTPPWMATWLMIIADNTLHLLINTGAVIWL
ncbi:DUF3307 domain-containing protein [Microbacterium sp. MPKO10]|uniref:DUF3307 domain-containing protein n=1 Tax=Microbacterium sp. MPKO10 TaxID=2989818 RepID=UPI002236A163|nr:DUF3307 domain-containing protein [Microbacterium sp. MPKO10]MCW4458174.1 DUF3307 domain-containing protein [Microbacterium sp. MPKO10]